MMGQQIYFFKKEFFIFWASVFVSDTSFAFEELCALVIQFVERF